MSLIAVLIIVFVILAMIGAFGFVIWRIVKNPLGLPEPKKLGESCTLHTDCENWGPGATQNACCKGKCTQKVNGWCPGEGPNAGQNIGGGCEAASDCKGWGWGIGGRGVMCCEGKCEENPHKLVTCPYPPGTWLAAFDVPNASKLCRSGKTYQKGLDIFCA